MPKGHNAPAHYDEVLRSFDVKYALKGPPTPAQMRSICLAEFMARLKAPATAKVANDGKPYYDEYRATYYYSASIDAQNSYGALVRESYPCLGVYAGDLKAGTLYLWLP